MYVYFDLLTNTSPAQFITLPVDEAHRESVQTSAGEMRILCASLTLTQLNNAVLILKPTHGNLNAEHVMDIFRQSNYSIFGREKPLIHEQHDGQFHAKFIETILKQKNTALSCALLRMLELKLFSQTIFLFALKETVNARIFQLEGESSRKFPGSERDMASSIEVTEVSEEIFSVTYKNHLGYYIDEGMEKAICFGGVFNQTIQFKLVSSSSLSVRHSRVNTYSTDSDCLFLQMRVMCAEYQVLQKDQEQLKRLGFQCAREPRTLITQRKALYLNPPSGYDLQSAAVGNVSPLSPTYNTLTGIAASSRASSLFASPSPSRSPSPFVTAPTSPMSPKCFSPFWE